MLIQDLALYEITKGGMRIMQKEDLEVLQNRFAEYKSLIKRGEFTYDELCERIYAKWGIVDRLNPRPTISTVHTYDAEPFHKGVDQTKAFLDEIAGLLKKEKASQKPYKWYQKLWDRFRLICSRFYVNI